ncbi:MAG: orotate phosphoribosyltransferase [Planctomycetales bacterium]|nr:orotate phosphoribosyltransferase [Planctomycetales bacterium]
MASATIDALQELIRQDALKFGEFTLASGATSSYYLDCRKVTLQSRGAALIGAAILEHLGDELPDAVGGMAIGADPITGAVITVAGLQGRQLNGFIVRKEQKGHGTQQMVEGPVKPGDRVVIVEDVVTTGGSSVKAIQHARDFGLEVTKVIGIVDRLQGGEAAFRDAGCDFHALLSIRDFGVDA